MTNRATHCDTIQTRTGPRVVQEGHYLQHHWKPHQLFRRLSTPGLFLLLQGSTIRAVIVDMECGARHRIRITCSGRYTSRKSMRPEASSRVLLPVTPPEPAGRRRWEVLATTNGKKPSLADSMIGCNFSCNEAASIAAALHLAAQTQCAGVSSPQ